MAREIADVLQRTENMRLDGSKPTLSVSIRALASHAIGLEFESYRGISTFGQWIEHRSSEPSVRGSG
jgi:hypothetical protein